MITNVAAATSLRPGLLLLGALMLFSAPCLAKVDVTVDIQGVTGELLKNVRAFLSIEQQKSDPNLSVGRLRRLHLKADQEIKQALQPFGYYHPEIKKELTRQDSKWTARYYINLGVPVRVEEVDLKLTGQGAGDPQFQRLVSDFPLHRGDILNQRQYEDARDAFQNLATERGYFDFTLTRHELRLDLRSNTATVVLHMDTGERYRFGLVTFDQDILDDSLLRRYPHFKTGDPYSTDDLLDLHSALSNSDYFSKIDIQAQRDQIKGLEVPVRVALSPQHRNRYSAGIGYGTDTGARASLGWDIRRLNHHGHYMKNSLTLSEVRNNLSSSYIIPGRDPRTDSYGINASWNTENTTTSDTEIAALGINQTIMRHSGWLQTTYVNLQRELYTVGNQSGEATMVVPGMTWTRIHAKNRIYTRRGDRISVDVKGSHPYLGSDSAFIQSRLQAKLIRGITAASRIILRGDLGLTHVGNFSTLPPSFRFFAGGDQSVRGYAYNSLGPTDSSGKVVGGNQLMVGSVEFEYTITGKWGGALFYDVGNAIDDFATTLKKGAGFGLRWRSPVGMVRLDLAWALSKDGTPVRIHFNVGPDL
jgi:translocation and assembly module TamA